MAKREQIAEDSVRQSPPVVLGGIDEIEQAPPLRTPEIELAAFMEELLTINVSDSSDPNATPLVEVAVNGRRVLIPRNENVQIARKYVERLARAKSVVYKQDLDPKLGEGINKLQRRRSLDYPFTVISDPSGPRGQEWLQLILAET